MGFQHKSLPSSQSCAAGAVQCWPASAQRSYRAGFLHVPVSSNAFLNANTCLYHSLILVHSDLHVNLGDTVLDLCDKNKLGKCNPKLEIMRSHKIFICFFVLHCRCKAYVQICTVYEFV